VLLYEGLPAEARRLAQTYTEFDVILCQSEDDEGPGQTEQVGNTCLVKGVGHKGKNVGVLGVFKTGNPAQPYGYRYHLVPLGEEYLTPAGQEATHPIARLMEQYTQELRSGGYLRKYGQGNHPMQVAVPGSVPTYVGSERCKKCHTHAYDVWKNSAHAHAYQTLADVKHPSLRQYDGECVVCHVTGFAYKSGFTDVEATAHLKDVGCEACHGPGSAHAKDPENPQWHKLMNPWKAPPEENAAQKAARILAIDKACQRCHDPDNDVHWNYEAKWPKIEHHTPE
jgi:cytochrome c554/c'-like protein